MIDGTDDEVVTRRILREELGPYATKADLERYATKDDLQRTIDRALEPYATKADVRQVIDTVGKMLVAFRDDFLLELARHVKAAQDETRTFIAGLDDRYRDLPPRVTRLEVKVFAPKRRGRGRGPS